MNKRFIIFSQLSDTSFWATCDVAVVLKGSCPTLLQACAEYANLSVVKIHQVCGFYKLFSAHGSRGERIASDESRARQGDCQNYCQEMIICRGMSERENL